MAEQKTKPTQVSVESFLDKVSDEGIRDDCHELVKIMKKITGSEPKMWGPGFVGFEPYITKSGHEDDACLTGFSPRLTLPIMPGLWNS